MWSGGLREVMTRNSIVIGDGGAKVNEEAETSGKGH